MFLKGLLCSARLHLFDQKYSKNSIVIKYEYNLEYFLFYFNIFDIFPVMAQLNFQQPLLQSSVLRDSSEVCLIC